MMRSKKVKAVISGMGVITPAGVGVNAFNSTLMNGVTHYTNTNFKDGDIVTKFPLAKPELFLFKEELEKIKVDEYLIKQAKRHKNLSKSSSWGILTALEAWKDSGINDFKVDKKKMAVVIGGSNFQQEYLQLLKQDYHNRLKFLNPNYALNFLDTDLLGVLTEIFQVKGEGYSVGAASASGNMAIIHAVRLVCHMGYDVVMVVAPLMELSMYEFFGFTNLGAMAKLSEGSDVNKICNPFDKKHSGFVYGESAGCLIIESDQFLSDREGKGYCTIEGYGISLDGNRNPNPSVEGEITSMETALRQSQITPSKIDYISTHGTSSPIGDQVEVNAIIGTGTNSARINSTKSIIGHGLSAAGLVECIAGVLQMKNDYLHCNINLTDPISNELNWVGNSKISETINIMMNNSFGFGGINTSVVLKKIN